MGVLSSTLKLSLTDGVSKKMGAINSAISRFQSRTKAMSSPLDGMVGRVAGAAAAYIGVSEGIGRTFGAASKLQDQFTEIGIKTGATTEQISALQARLTGIAPATNQFTSDLATGVDVMTGMGLGLDQALAAIPAIGKAATATGASMEDLSAASVSAMQNLKVTPGELTKVLDGMTSAGNSGAFELKEMAQYFPELGAGYQALGQKGVGAVNDLAAALQVVRTGTGDSATAANDLKNLLQKVRAPQTIKAFKGLGVNLEKELTKAATKGLTPIEAIAEITNKAIGGDLGKIGDLFQDAQVQEALRPLIQSIELYRKIRAEANAATGTVSEAFAKRMNNASEKLKAFSLRFDNLGASIGSKLIGPIGDAAAYVTNVFDTLDRRVTIFDRIQKSSEGFLSGLGLGNNLTDQTGGVRDLLFGKDEGGAAAGERLAGIFANFRAYGADLRELNDSIRSSKIGAFLEDLAGSAALLGISKWGRLFIIAGAIKAVVDAAKDAKSIGEFVNNLKGLSALEWAGVGAGLLMVASRTAKVVGWFQKLKGVTPAEVASGGAKAMPKPGIPEITPSGGLLSRSLKGGVLGALLQMGGEAGIRAGFKSIYGERYVEPPDLPTSIANTVKAFGLGGSGQPHEAAPQGQNVFAGVEARLNGTPLTAEALAAAIRPSGPQPVTVTNPQAPNVTVSNVFNISGAGDAKAVAAAVVAHQGEAIKSAVESSTGGGGGF